MMMKILLASTSLRSLHEIVWCVEVPGQGVAGLGYGFPGHVPEMASCRELSGPISDQHAFQVVTCFFIFVKVITRVVLWY